MRCLIYILAFVLWDIIGPMGCHNGSVSPSPQPQEVPEGNLLDQKIQGLYMGVQSSADSCARWEINLSKNKVDAYVMDQKNKVLASATEELTAERFDSICTELHRCELQVHKMDTGENAMNADECFRLSLVLFYEDQKYFFEGTNTCGEEAMWQDIDGDVLRARLILTGLFPQLFQEGNYKPSVH